MNLGACDTDGGGGGVLEGGYSTRRGDGHYKLSTRLLFASLDDCGC